MNRIAITSLAFGISSQVVFAQPSVDPAMQVPQAIGDVRNDVERVGNQVQELDSRQHGLERRQIEFEQQMRSRLGELAGKPAPQENDKIDYLSERFASNPEAFKKAMSLFDKLVKEAKSKKLADGRTEFWAQLLEQACKLDCEIKSHLAELDAKYADEIANLKAAVRDLQQRMGVQPGLPGVPQRAAQPARWWNGVPDAIVDDVRRVAGPATLAWPNIKRRFGDGDIYYGDVYRDRYRRIILVRNVNNRPLPYNVARPVQ